MLEPTSPSKRTSSQGAKQIMKNSSIQDYSKVGGWLYLVGIGLVLSTIRTCQSLATDFLPMFWNGTWAQLADSSIGLSGNTVAVLIVVEVAINLALVAFAVLLAFQLSKKSPNFPKNSIFYFVAISVFPILDAVVASFLVPNNSPSAGQVGSMIGGAISSVIWVLYMLRSVRVKQTFRPRDSLASDNAVPSHATSEGQEENTSEKN